MLVPSEVHQQIISNFTPAEAPDEADEAHEDEEMTDLLDFLEGSGAAWLGDFFDPHFFLFPFFLVYIILFFG